MSLLLLSILALALGPAVVAIAGARSWVLALVDGFVIVTIGGIALIHILPHALLSCGAWALVGAAAGLLGPMLLERRGHAHHDDAHGGDPHTHRPAMALAMLGIAAHAFLDGSAFADHGHAGDAHAHGATELLGLAVVLHRIPEGLAIWWLVRPQHGGKKTAIFALALVAAATALGARFGDAVVDGAGGQVFSFFQAVVAGSLLHVLIHHAPPPPAAGRGGLALAPALGALAGGALLVAVSMEHPAAQRVAHELAMGPAFVTLALASAPALLLAYVASGLVRALLPRGLVSWLGRGGALSQSLRGLLVGPLLPVCSCGALPLYRTMLARGAPHAAALTLLVAAPEIGLATLLLSWPLLGGPLTIARALAAVVAALAMGYVLARVGRAAGPGVAAPPPAAHEAHANEGWGERLLAGARHGLGDAVDHTIPWVLIGLGFAAFAEPQLDGAALSRLPEWIEVPVFALLGIPVAICASGATPVIAVLLHKGISPGAAIAFLLTGPATNLMTFRVLAGLHGKRFAAAFAAAMVVVPTALGWGANLVFARERPDLLHAAALAPAAPIEVVSLAVLAVLVAVSLVRHGPRRMVAHLVSSGR